jgi:uncharacterized HhH-GPD family protein
MPDVLPFTEDDAANRLLATDPLALLIGMLLDQQVPMERAFLGPHLLRQRLGTLDADRIADLPEEELVEAFRGPPALHRFPASMAKRTQALCRHLRDTVSGPASALWETAANGDELLSRLRDLPGFGEAKARIFIKVIGERLDAAPEGWERHAADWPSIADVETFDDVAVLRERKRAMKGKRR